MLHVRSQICLAKPRTGREKRPIDGGPKRLFNHPLTLHVDRVDIPVRVLPPPTSAPPAARRAQEPPQRREAGQAPFAPVCCCFRTSGAVARPMVVVVGAAAAGGTEEGLQVGQRQPPGVVEGLCVYVGSGGGLYGG